MSEYHEGESEVVWTHQAILNHAQREVVDLTDQQSFALERKMDATNTFSALVASVAVFTSGRKMKKARERLDFALQLPQPSDTY